MANPLRTAAEVGAGKVLLYDAGGLPVSSRATQVGVDNTPLGPVMVNQRTGMGGANDHTVGTAFNPLRLAEHHLMGLYQASWVAQKIVDIPVDDVWHRGGRHFAVKEDDDDSKDDAKGEGAKDDDAKKAKKKKGDDSPEDENVKAFQKVLKDLKVRKRIKQAMKAGRLYGGALLVVLPKNGDTESELEDPADIDKDGIANLLVVNRWRATPVAWYGDPFAPHYGEVYWYRITPRFRGGAAESYLVHSSRVFRFNGREPLETEGWNDGWNELWGLPVLSGLLQEIYDDAATRSAIAHLIQECSIVTVRVEGFKDALRGRQDPGEATAEQIATAATQLKSVYRMGFIDKEDEIARLSVQFSGLPDLMDRLAQRLAAAGDIPMTRFYAQSPAGMNATGDSDAANYELMVDTHRTDLDDEVLPRLDAMLAAHAGIGDPPEYDWLPIMEKSDLDRAQASKVRTEALMLTAGQVLDEDEVRERLSEDELFGELGAMPEGLAADDDDAMDAFLQAQGAPGAPMPGAKGTPDSNMPPPPANAGKAPPKDPDKDKDK